MTAGVQSIDRAFAILRTLAESPGGVSDVARRTRLPVSTCARLLASLESLGAVQRVEPGLTFRIGTTIRDLSSAVDPASGLVARARPYLEALVAQVGETAGVSVADGTRHVLYLDQVESGQDVTLQDWTGERLPLHVVSSGLVLLAARSNAQVSAYCADRLEGYTDRTITRVGDLRKRLTRIRAEGYAWTVEEFADGISSVAAPIVDHAGVVTGAFHIHGPSYRLRPSNRAIARALLSTTRSAVRA